MHDDDDDDDMVDGFEYLRSTAEEMGKRGQRQKEKEGEQVIDTATNNQQPKQTNEMNERWEGEEKARR